MTKQRVLAGMFTASVCSGAWLVAAIALDLPLRVLVAAGVALVLSGAVVATLRNELTWERTKPQLEPLAFVDPRAKSGGDSGRVAQLRPE